MRPGYAGPALQRSKPKSAIAVSARSAMRRYSASEDWLKQRAPPALLSPLKQSELNLCARPRLM